MFLSTALQILQPLLAFFHGWSSPNTTSPQATRLSLELRQIHAVSSNGHVVFSDVVHPLNFSTSAVSQYHINTRPLKLHKPSSFEEFSRAKTRSVKYGQSIPLDWDEEEVLGPDVEQRETLLILAKMTYNAYIAPNDTQWYDLGTNWTVSHPFGWAPEEDGFQGHVFATPDNSTIVLAIKGTSAGVFGGGGPTARKDKLNDNILFSCCCARVDWTWTTVCDCCTGNYKCDQNCVERAMLDDGLFYPAGINLYNNLTYIYPDSNIWIIGHSLGGALASLISITFGRPSVTFECPGEKMAAQRLHLPSPPSSHHITHVYHTADPIPMGTCNGIFSSCSLAGYAMESRCHLGLNIVYDTVSNLSWTVDVRMHSIANVIDRLLSEPWAPSEEIGRQVPEAVPQDDCVECYPWEFGDYNL